jgi:hypothetical protein
MDNIILEELMLNFKDIEKEIFSVVCEAGISRIKLILENLDDLLFKNRDKKEYRYKFKTEKNNSDYNRQFNF